MQPTDEFIKMTDETNFCKEIDNNRNKNSVRCQFCNSIILKPNSANYSENEVSFIGDVWMCLCIAKAQLKAKHTRPSAYVCVFVMWCDVNCVAHSLWFYFNRFFYCIAFVSPCHFWFSSIYRWCTRRRKRSPRVNRWRAIGRSTICSRLKTLASRIRYKTQSIWYVPIVRWDLWDTMTSSPKSVSSHWNVSNTWAKNKENLIHAIIQEQQYTNGTRAEKKHQFNIIVFTSTTMMMYIVRLYKWCMRRTSAGRRDKKHKIEAIRIFYGKLCVRESEWHEVFVFDVRAYKQ